MNKPDSPGTWHVSGILKFGAYSDIVAVECNPASGIFCRELKMGGSIHCGFNDWDRVLEWERLCN